MSELAKEESDVRSAVLAVVQDYPDFPKPGILFKDVLPVLGDPQLLQRLTRLLAAKAAAIEPKVTSVAGLEARGFLFGPLVALEMGLPFVPIRKKGKLPGPTISAEYEKEYGKDIIEVQKGVVGQGDRVLVVDDLIATGGSLAAAVSLLQSCGAVVPAAYVLVELDALKGRSLVPDVAVDALLHF